MATNDKVIRFTAWAQVAILAILVAGALYLRSHRPGGTTGMVRTTEWATPSGEVETLQSNRELGETFTEFRLRHEAAVKELIGG